jgi:hypothetical protein
MFAHFLGHKHVIHIISYLKIDELKKEKYQQSDSSINAAIIKLNELCQKLKYLQD